MPSDRAPTTASGESFDWGPVDVGDSDMGDAQITDWAIAQLGKSSGKPFLLCLGYYRPHIPLWAPRRYFEMYPPDKVKLPPFLSNDLQDLSDVAKHWALEPVTAGAHETVVRHQQWRNAVSAYLACVSFIDHQVGRLIDALDASPAAANTIVVLWSDHGWHLGEKQHWGKWTGWERSTRVPLIIVQAKKGNDPQAGTRCDEPVGLIDLYPTLIELCALESPDDLDGRSLVPSLLDPRAKTDREVITTFDKGNVTVRTKRWRYIRYSDATEELYDHSTDPNEWRNLGNDPTQRETIEQFRRRIPRAAL
jgi:arylsulfatase A-like enzyme